MKSYKLLGVLTLALLPSFLKVPFLRMRGANIGKGSKISMFSIFWVDHVQIGEDTKIAPFTLVRCRTLVLGNRVQIKAMVAIDTIAVKIGHDSIVMEQVVVGGMKTPRSSLTIGARVKIFPYSFINPTEPILIEDEVGVGGANYIFTHGSWQSALDGYPISFGPVTIRKGVWLPWRVFILPNVEIGENCTIGANSVINKNVPPNCLAAGAPAKLLATDASYLRVKNLEQKLSYVDDILSDMFDFMCFEGTDVRRTVFENGFSAVLSRKEIEIITYIRDGVIPEPFGDVVLSFSKISDQTIEKLISANCAWLDIESRQCYFGKSSRFNEVRIFFGRYGVRFSVWGEQNI